MAEIVVEGLEVVDVEQEHAERLTPFRGREGLAQEFVERPSVGKARQRVGPGALLGPRQRIADHVELAGLFRKARFQPGRPGGGPRQLVHELGDQRLRIDAGLALVRDLADGLNLRMVVGDRGRQEIPGRPHQALQPLGRVDHEGTHLGCDIGLEQLLIGPAVEGTIVVDQEVDRVAQIVVAAREILVPHREIGRRRCNPLLGHAPHRPSGDGGGIVVIGIVEAGIHRAHAVMSSRKLALTP